MVDLTQQIPAFALDMLAPESSRYRINISHPLILPLYNQYKRSLGSGIFPLSDAERHAFEHPFLEHWGDCGKARMAALVDQIKNTEE